MNQERNFGRFEELSYETVSSLDPLDLDEFMTELPSVNKDKNIPLLIATLEYAVGTSESSIKEGEDAKALASLRDIDFILSSLLRHGVKVQEEIPGLEGELKRLATISGTIPRGSVFTYAAANPEGSRRRSFTGTLEENGFIEAVKQSCIELDKSLVALGALPEDFDDAALNQSMQPTLWAIQKMVDSIISVHRTVSPDFFSNEMRPYFEPLTIYGETFTGAGGAQMQLLAVDRIIWGLDSRDDVYNSFFQENAKYLTPSQRKELEKYIVVHDGRSILSYIKSSPGKFLESASTTYVLLSQIKKFRYPHRKVASENFKLRDDDAVGSGQYKPDILDVLINETEAALDKLKKIVKDEE